MPREYRSMNKLICIWTVKNNYYTHYRNSKFFVETDVSVSKVKIVTKFKQKRWLKPKIDMKTDLKSRAEKTPRS